MFLFLFENGNQMINATEMVKIFNKRINDYLRQESTQEYIQAISDDTGIPVSEVYQVVKGGNPWLQGTWMYEDLALDFAQWLSPKFKLWCNRKLKEMFLNGVVYLKTSEFNSLHEHMFAQVQRNNSKAVAVKNGGVEKDVTKIVKYFKEMFEAYVGMTPSSLKAWARKQGVPLSIVRMGGRETLRYLAPEQASVISFIDNALSSNPNLTLEDMYNLIKIGKRLEPEFKEMGIMGIGDHNDLKYLDKMNRIKLN